MNIQTTYHDFIGEWQAVDGDTFDAEIIDGQYSTTCPIGTGKTEAEAIVDLMEQIAEREASDV